jgi:hypothetical protein
LKAKANEHLLVESAKEEDHKQLLSKYDTFPTSDPNSEKPIRGAVEKRGGTRAGPKRTGRSISTIVVGL